MQRQIDPGQLAATIKHLQSAADHIYRHHGGDKSAFSTLEHTILMALDGLKALRSRIEMAHAA